ncbi:M24 family metallopeptidase [Aestuariibius sp. 2305UL40-4]|uniref:M24 family metallopeptidase n=1 Tax=Aestuariibius violaceus TaxID=3234132 RepID=UPI00345E6522
MFQTFTPSTSPDQSPPRLAALRDELKKEGVDAFLVPRADRFQGEYVAPCDDRLAWLTGFTGSAGFAVVSGKVTALFVDSRYTLQADAQTPGEITILPWPKTQLSDWLKDEIGRGKIAYDPWLHTESQIRKLNEAFEDTGLSLLEIDNLIDRIWPDQPDAPDARFSAYPANLAGKSHDDKRAEITEALRDAGQKQALITLPDSIAWLLNIRGSDIPRNPVPHAMAILHDNGAVDLFATHSKTTEIASHLGPDVAVHDPGALINHLKTLDGPLRIDPDSAPKILFQSVEKAGVSIEEAPDPVLLPKAKKNPTELQNTREAHLRDAAAVTAFLAWLDAQPIGSIDEITAVKELEQRRRASGQLLDISFETIAGTGPNGAIVHYRVTEETNRQTADGDLLLVDSGGQYIDGTTDITRTIPIGAPSDDKRKTYTAVLQGVIAISLARFPQGTAGRDLDPLARAALRRMGKDYGHGTGHGVGVYLSVHEGPQRIASTSGIALEKGMILSNEPGYYEEGAYGIRLENLVAVTPDSQDDWLAFETLTFVPFDRRLIDTAILAPFERDWIDAYHAETKGKVMPRLASDEARAWLEKATRPLTDPA